VGTGCDGAVLGPKPSIEELDVHNSLTEPATASV
jgi:hypothetical protein